MHFRFASAEFAHPVELLIRSKLGCSRPPRPRPSGGAVAVSGVKTLWSVLDLRCAVDLPQNIVNASLMRHSVNAADANHVAERDGHRVRRAKSTR
jgi:hypothetical protein